VIDGTDNFAAKFLAADACHFAGKPYSHAGILRFEGQAMTVIPGKTACYRCVFRHPPPPGTVPSCLRSQFQAKRRLPALRRRPQHHRTSGRSGYRLRLLKRSVQYNMNRPE
jgi:molybdopterin/thiamine biosynthesis adenylyltransferase